jgi:hypothetical protein
MSEHVLRTIRRRRFRERWAAWQARGAAHDRATRRKLLVFAAIVVLSSAVLMSVNSFTHLSHLFAVCPIIEQPGAHARVWWSE